MLGDNRNFVVFLWADLLLGRAVCLWKCTVKIVGQLSAVFTDQTQFVGVPEYITSAVLISNSGKIQF